MKTKIVYAVTSDEKDYYLEQTLVSVYSLRLYNPQATVILLVDNKTDTTLIDKRAKILEYISDKIVVNIPDKYTKKERSRYLKTTIRQNVKGPYLFIDSDTIITDDLSEIDNLLDKGINIAAVKDNHCDFKDMLNYKLILSRAHIIGWDKYLKRDVIHFNSGVMFINDSDLANEFYEKWHSNWLYECDKGICYDQLAMAYTNQQLNYPICEIEGIWNCQICQDGIRYLSQAKIIHYFGDIGNRKSYYFRNIYIWDKIKKDGDINQDSICWIKNGKGAFIGHHFVCDNDDEEFIFSYFRKLYSHFPTFFKIVDKGIGLLFKFCHICTHLYKHR